MTSPAVVQSGNQEYTVLPDESLTFGRSERCTICLQPADDGISRWAGSLRCESGAWWLNNESETRPFDVVDPLGFVHPLAPGARYALDGGRVEAVLTGLVHRFCVAVAVPPRARPPRPVRSSSGRGTATGAKELEALITHNERVALVAMFASQLRTFPKHDDRPTTYKQAGRRAGLSAVAVRKRVEHVRDKLNQAGVPGLRDDRALERLGTYLIATGIITGDDLTLLPPARGGDGR